MRNALPTLSLLLALPALAASQGAPRDSVPATLVGRWEGRAAIDSGSVETGIPLLLDIAADGTVSGTVGDARLVNGRIGRNRSLPARLLGLGTQWMLEGGLEGPMLRATAFTRERARMPLDLVGDVLEGDLNAVGGGKAISVRARLLKVG